MAFGGANVGDDGVLSHARERLLDQRRERTDGCAGKDGVGAAYGLGYGSRGVIDCPAVGRGGQSLGTRVVADDLGVSAFARGQSNRATDQPDAEDRYPHP